MTRMIKATDLPEMLYHFRLAMLRDDMWSSAQLAQGIAESLQGTPAYAPFAQVEDALLLAASELENNIAICKRNRYWSALAAEIRAAAALSGADTEGAGNET